MKTRTKTAINVEEVLHTHLETQDKDGIWACSCGSAQVFDKKSFILHLGQEAMLLEFADELEGL